MSRQKSDPRAIATPHPAPILAERGVASRSVAPRDTGHSYTSYRRLYDQDALGPGSVRHSPACLPRRLRRHGPAGGKPAEGRIGVSGRLIFRQHSVADFGRPRLRPFRALTYISLTARSRARLTLQIASSDRITHDQDLLDSPSVRHYSSCNARWMRHDAGTRRGGYAIGLPRGKRRLARRRGPRADPGADRQSLSLPGTVADSELRRP